MSLRTTAVHEIAVSEILPGDGREDDPGLKALNPGEDEDPSDDSDEDGDDDNGHDRTPSRDEALAGVKLLHRLQRSSEFQKAEIRRKKNRRHAYTENYPCESW